MRAHLQSLQVRYAGLKRGHTRALRSLGWDGVLAGTACCTNTVRTITARGTIKEKRQRAALPEIIGDI